jgi:hypothetical protein
MGVSPVLFCAFPVFGIWEQVLYDNVHGKQQNGASQVVSD